MKEVNLNFGALKESILKLSSRDFVNENRKGYNVNKFAKEINDSPLLMKQHLVFKSLNTDKTFGKERLAERFINQTLQIFNNVKWEDVLKENERLRKEYLDNTHVGSTTNNDNLYNAIHTLIESKCKGNKFTKIEEEQNAYEFVVNSLMSNKGNKVIEESDYPKKEKMWQFITNLAVNNFQERYSHLSESEIKLVKILLSPHDNKLNYLKDLKQENLTIIASLIKESKEEDNSILESFRKKINNINEESSPEINDSIISCFQLKENLQTLL